VYNNIYTAVFYNSAFVMVSVLINGLKYIVLPLFHAEPTNEKPAK